MTMRFHEGQDVEVEVCDVSASPNGGTWAHAKIVHETPAGLYHVEFPNGTRAAFDVENSRAGRLDMIDLGAEALRQQMQGGKQIRAWGTLPNSSKRKWRDYARVVLCAAKVLP